MLTPIDISRPAPDMPASIIPGPAPVTTIHPFSDSDFATSCVSLYNGSSLVVRADPKMVTFLRFVYGANITNASRISVSAAVAIFRFNVLGLSLTSFSEVVISSTTSFLSSLDIVCCEIALVTSSSINNFNLASSTAVSLLIASILLPLRLALISIHQNYFEMI